METKKSLDFAYKLSEGVFWVVFALFTVAAYLLFGIESMFYVAVSLVVAHELPSYIMGRYMIKRFGDTDMEI